MAQINAEIIIGGNRENIGFGEMATGLRDAGYTFGGEITPTSTPSPTEQSLFFAAMTAGTYTNYGNIVVAAGEIAFIYKENGSWVKVSKTFATPEQGELADTAYQKPDGGIPSTDMTASVQTSLGKADTAIQSVAVGTTTTGEEGTDASVTNSGTPTNPVFDFTIPRGDSAVNPFKGWFEAGTTETSNLPANPSVGDYAYVMTVDGENNPITKVYDCVTANTWHDSGRTIDTSNVQTFETLQQVNEVSIVDDLTTGGSNDVLSAEQGKVLKQEITQLDQETYTNGIKSIKLSVTGNKKYDLPAPIPVGSHVIITTDAVTPLVIRNYINYGLSDQSETQIIKGYQEIINNSNEIFSIYPTTACNITLTVINGNITNNIKDDSVTVDKIKGEHIYSNNLFNKDDVVDGYYVKSNNGRLTDNANYSASNFIKVKPNTYYKPNIEISQSAWFDADKKYISGNSATSSSLLSPNNAAYIKISVLTNNKATLMFNEGQTSLPYEAYYEKVSNPNIIGGIDEEELTPIVSSAVTTAVATAVPTAVNDSLSLVTTRLWNGILTATDDSFGDTESISISDYPKALKKGDKIVFEASITSFGGGFSVGKGMKINGGAYITVNDTQIMMKRYTSSEISLGSVNHGLTISTYVKVIISITATKWKVILQTLSGTFVTEFNCAYGVGSPTLLSNGTSFTNAKISATNEDFSQAIWMFGDSYFGIAENIREMYWLNEWGYLNTLVDGQGGWDATDSYNDLVKCIAISKPKYLVFALGMNNNNLTTWQNKITDVMNLCTTNGITLILTTIPQPRNTTSYKYKDDMSTYVRNSGYRYIDTAKAVGSNAQGEWYGNNETWDYQSTDNVHTSEYGAKAIATQFLIDFPEIMQY